MENRGHVYRCRVQRYLPLDKPERGDVIFVHSGKRSVFGIGVVYRNDYRQSSHANGIEYMCFG